MKATTKRFAESIQVGALSLEERRAAMRALRSALPGLAPDADDRLLDTIALLFNQASVRSSGALPAEKTSAKVKPGRKLFGTDYRLALVEHCLGRTIMPRQTAGQLLVWPPDDPVPEAVGLTLFEYLIVREIVKKNLAVKEASAESFRLSSVICTGAELLEVFTDFRGVHVDQNLPAHGYKEITDHVDHVKKKIKKLHLPPLILGTFVAGYRLDTHPHNVLYIPPPAIPSLGKPGALREEFENPPTSTGRRPV